MESRAVDLEKAIKIIEEKQKELCPAGVYGRNYVYGSDREKWDAWDEIIDALDALPTITSPNEWVNAKDNPPQLTGKYICCVEDTHGYMWSIPADYLLEMKTWVGEFGEIKNKVVYWMPLPAPPAKGGDR